MTGAAQGVVALIVDQQKQDVGSARGIGCERQWAATQQRKCEGAHNCGESRVNDGEMVVVCRSVFNDSTNDVSEAC